MKRTSAKAMSVATTLAVAGAVAGAGTLGSSGVASPVVEPVSLVASPAAVVSSPVHTGDSRAAFAQRASRNAADRAERLAAIRAAKAKAKAKAARAEARRKAIARKKAAAKARRVQARALAAQHAAVPGSARALGRQMAAARGWTGYEWAALDNLWSAESGWSTTAGNGYTGAYGIPQALPGGKMSSHGADWRTSARTQISWGLSYIAQRWGSPSNAWANFQSAHWY